MKWAIGFYVAAVVLMFVGWGLNAYKFATSDFERPFHPEVIRAVGVVVVPFGAVVSIVPLEN